MDKIQFDSFYKFLVSIGTILIVAPIFFLHYLISGAYDIILTQEDFQSLSDISMELLNQKTSCLFFIYKFLPIFCILLIVVGVALFIYGCYKWNTIQQTAINKLTDLDIKEKELNLEKMTAPEIAEKIITENTEQDENSSISTSYKSATSIRVRKAFEIEDACYRYISAKLGRKYICHQNVRLENSEYDILAESLTSAHDILYEIKYWPNPISFMSITSLFERIKRMEQAYGKNMSRKYRICVLIITSEKELDKIQSRVQQYAFQEKDPLLDIEFICESTLIS